MFTGEFNLSTDNSQQFAAVNRDNVKDIFSLHKVVCVTNIASLYRCLSLIYFNIFPWSPLLIFLPLEPLEVQNSHSVQFRISRIYLRKIKLKC